MSLLLKNATYIDWETLSFRTTDIIVNEGVDNHIKFFSNYPENDLTSIDHVLDCKGKIVTKSFAVGHHHAYSALARGMYPPEKSTSCFYDILKNIWWTLDKCLDEEMIEYCALTTAIACAKAGSTFVIDHHASPNAIKGSLEIIAGAFEKVGISHLLCYEISDRDGKDVARKGLDETSSYLENHQGLVGLHASFTIEDDTMLSAVELMNNFNSGIHIHVAEDKYDQEHCLKNYKKRVVSRLSNFGILKSSKTILAHCLHLDDKEKDLIYNSPCWVVQNTESNLNNNVGYFDGRGLGENIMSGTDGMHSDMLQSVRSAYLVGQGFDSINYRSAYTRFRNVHYYLKKNGFRGDGDNNLVILDYDSPTGINTDNFLSHFIYGFNSRHINDVISNGRVIVENRVVKTVDEADILNVSRSLSVRLWDKMKMQGKE